MAWQWQVLNPALLRACTSHAQLAGAQCGDAPLHKSQSQGMERHGDLDDGGERKDRNGLQRRWSVGYKAYRDTPLSSWPIHNARQDWLVASTGGGRKLLGDR